MDTEPLNLLQIRHKVCLEQIKGYSDEDFHHTSKWLCGIRDFEKYPILVERMERLLFAYVARRQAGMPVIVKEIEAEFGCDETSFEAELTKSKTSV